MKIVKFKDDLYGIRKMDENGKYIYLNLDYHTKWHEHLSSEFNAYCKHKRLEIVVKIYEKILDIGTPLTFKEIYKRG